MCQNIDIIFIIMDNFINIANVLAIYWQYYRLLKLEKY